MDYSKTVDAESVNKTMAALKARNIEAEFVATKEEAMARIKELIPSGASVNAGSSTTLNEIGFTDLLKSGKHSWNNLKEAVLAEKDPAKQAQLRRTTTVADFYLGSVHAVTEEGDSIIASNTGSQLPAYAYSAGNVIWVVGTQKIVSNLDEAMKRLHEYVIPLEDARMKSTGAPGTDLRKILIFKSESPYNNRKIHMIFIGEKLGF
jgi:L-lactate utilization protein LutC